MRTAKEEREWAEGLGLEGEALEVWVQATAPERHAWRVEQAKVALLGGDGHERYSPSDTAEAVFVAVLDQNGIGGHLGTGRGGETTRYPTLRALGKGRKQAVDGPAWDAAILEAARGIAKGRGSLLRARPDKTFVELWWSGEDDPVRSRFVPDAAWLHALARYVVCELSKGRTAYPPSGLVELHGDAEAWGDTLNATALVLSERRAVLDAANEAAEEDRW